MGEGPGAKPEVARVFLENDGEDSVTPESAVRTVESRGAKALAVALGSLPEFWIGIARLTETGDKRICNEDKWIDRAFNIRWNFCPGERRGTPADISTVLKFGTTPKMRWRSSCFNTSAETLRPY